MDPAKPSLVTGLLLATFETFNQAYFMGFLFLIAGYFVPRAYDSKRGGRFSGLLRPNLPGLRRWLQNLACYRA
ncbi:MAG TPA: hypothetical protein VH351_19440 [Bryobacteraceae bacterium]|jgi:hypothetical protein|nr:hypothetical protein [Bryobacteraceae bacterium]